MTTIETTTPKTRTITLTDRPPVKIHEDDWPVIARAKDWDNQHECQANRTWHLRVREHADGRRIVYGVYGTQFQGERDAAGGYLVAATETEAEGGGYMPDTAATITAIHDVAEIIGAPQLAAECIANLPAEEI